MTFPRPIFNVVNVVVVFCSKKFFWFSWISQLCLRSCSVPWVLYFSCEKHFDPLASWTLINLFTYNGAINGSGPICLSHSRLGALEIFLVSVAPWEYIKTVWTLLYFILPFTSPPPPPPQRCFLLAVIFVLLLTWDELWANLFSPCYFPVTQEGTYNFPSFVL